MKTLIPCFLTGCAIITLSAAVILLLIPQSGFAQDEAYSIHFIGLQEDHEGTVGWNADGTGPEPAATGHLIPFPFYGNQIYYIASCDYDDIDSDPSACGGHFTQEVTGFPLFMQSLDDYGYTTGQVTMKYGYCSLGEDVEGQDWMVIDNWQHSFYYDNPFFIYLDGNLILQGVQGFIDMYIENTADPEWLCETGYMKLDSAWSDDENDEIKNIGRAFLADLNGEEIRIFFTDITSAGIFSGEGRNGAKYDVAGYIEKGLPELPFAGLASGHQGMAGWNADGNGPEPAGDGHGAQRYYIASPDYGGIDPDPDAAFGHFLPDMKGFLNFELQLAYRGYSPEQVLFKLGLASLADDVMGLDWGYEEGVYWCHYYDLDYKLQLDGQDIIRGMIDTSHSWMNASPLYWWCEVTYDRPRDNSALSSDDAKIIAAAFMKDIEDRKILNELQTLTYDTASFSGNGRYDGGYFNVEAARLVAKHADCGTFVQCDSLCNGLTDHTTWHVEHSPYFLDNDLVIDEGHKLIIEPGVDVKVRGPYAVNVSGVIDARATEDEMITFTHSNPNIKWNSIRLDGIIEEADSSLFNWCIFENASAISNNPIGYNSGGAIKINETHNTRISNCIFRNNSAHKSGVLDPSGGALGLWTASPIIENSTFYSNEAIHGGAIICHAGSNPHIKNCIFYDNQATQRGGAIIVYEGSAPVIEYCLFRNNFGRLYGGALSIENSSPQLINNTFTQNWSDLTLGTGGAINITGTSSPVLTNNLLWGDTANLYSEVRINSQECTPVFSYNDIKFGADSIGPEPVHADNYLNNINDDPVFCQYEEENPFTIADCSPCLTAGLNGTFIGAYGQGCICNDISENKNMTNGIGFFPNPINSGTLNIEFHFDNSGYAKLEIFNLTGEKVAEPVNGYLASGEHVYTFSVADFPAGIYMGRLTAGGQIRTSKFIRIR